MNPSDQIYRDQSPQVLIDKITESLLCYKESPNQEEERSFYYDVPKRKGKLVYCTFNTRMSAATITFSFFFPIVASYLTYTFGKDDSPGEFGRKKCCLGEMVVFLISNRAFLKARHEQDLEYLRSDKDDNQTGGFTSNYLANILSFQKDSPNLKRILDATTATIFCPFILTFSTEKEEIDFLILSEFLTYNALGPMVKFSPRGEDPKVCFEKLADLMSRIEDKGSKTAARVLTYPERQEIISKDMLTVNLFNNLSKGDSGLLAQKLRIFFDTKATQTPPIEYFESGGVGMPLVPEGNPDQDTSNFALTCQLNDLFYIHQLFLNPPKGVDYQDIILSRLLYHAEFPEASNNLAVSLKQTDPELASQYVTDKYKATSSEYVPLTVEIRVDTPLYLSDLIFPYNNQNLTNAWPIYSRIFQDVNYKKTDKEKGQEFTVQIKNSDLNLSVGGAHGGLMSISKKHPTEPLVAFIATDEMVYIDIDLQGYYVKILLEIYKGRGLFHEILKNLSDLRNKLKEAGEEANKIYKIIVLSISGQLNQTYFQTKSKTNTSGRTGNKLYDPRAYYSMTANGQLLLLEFLKRAEDVIENLILANTDGCTLQVKRSNLEKLFQIIKSFEADFDLSFNDRFILKRGIIFYGNHYIYNQIPFKAFTLEALDLAMASSSEVKTKGFSKTAMFYLETLAEEICNQMVITELWEAGVITYIPFATICSAYQALLEGDLKLSELFHRAQSSLSKIKEVKYYYFSKKPESFGGFFAGSDRTLEHNAGSSVSINTYLAEGRMYSKSNIVNDIRSKLCFWQYFTHALDYFSTALKKTHKYVEFQGDLLLRDHPKIGEYFYSYYITQGMAYFTNRGLFATPKQENKHNFTGKTQGIGGQLDARAAAKV
jgi:hypothetical protein